MLPKRTRLKTFDYCGPHRYFLTICTHQRRHLFRSAETVTAVLSQFLRAATEKQFAIHAYVFMPDHAHLLVEGTADTSDFGEFVKIAKQRSGYEYAKSGNGRLWQPSYFEHVLREEETTPRVIAYMFNNPIAAGLATEFPEYRFAGSDTVSVDSIAEMFHADPNPPWQP